MIEWHVVTVRPQRLSRALVALKEYGYEHWCPHIRELRPVAKRKLSLDQRKAGNRPMEPVLRPMFSGYMFVRMDLYGDWRRTFEFYGISGVLVTNGVPGRIDDRYVEALMSRVGEDGAIPGDTRLGELGDVLRICDGPFKDCEGTISELDESGLRVILDLLMFGRVIPVSLRYDQVERV